MDSNILVDNIRALCRKHKVSISKLESDLFLSPGLISRWSKSMPAMDKIVDIAQYFNVTIDELVGRSFIKSDYKNIDRLLTVLRNRSLQMDITWEILNFQDPPSNLTNITPSFFLINESCDCFYTSYMNGFIFLTAIHLSWDDLKLALFILPDIYSKPECICSDASQLKQLYEYLNRLYAKQLNKIKCANFINAFVNDSTPSDVSADEKVTPIRNINGVSNF